MDALKDELLRLNHSLLESIANRDWETYEKLCDPTLTSFEAEARGQLVEGLDFHHFYFRLPKSEPHHTTMASPHVRILGDVAIVSYVRINLRVTENSALSIGAFEETRVWQKQSGGWKHVHFHRSTPTS